MLLRSSSTPVLGSLLSSFSDSPNNSNIHHQSELHASTQKHTPSSIHGKLSCASGGSQNFSKSMFHSPSMAEMKSSGNGFRRAQSEGNLEQLADASYNVDEFTLTKRSARRTSCCNLEAIPSFSVNHLGTRFEDDDSDCEEEFEKEEGNDAQLEFEDSSMSLRVENLVLEQPKSNANDYGSLSFEGEGKMYLATGLGISGINFGGGGGIGGGSGGGGGSYRPVAFDRDSGDSQGLSMEEHYKSILEQNPGNPLFLRNYAQFLYQEKGDLRTAEEYYSRAILADPEDGEILSQYAKLIWELHHDKARATTYFERAIGASSEDSHIHAAYASFLWDIEGDEEDEENAAEGSQIGQQHLHHGLMASATA
ncbi:hypothetical protein CDL12_12666 [Handroanthus impetiginosus]|uniref:Uncharacterized protein n=1 Tax=Handroanthus impetiginosus TaxID=429701 RepID=A0A2G9HB30_9LAMI|nr:hypothetical protein CDL12_12666 [Handroanthus impetiginosus]